MEFPLAISKLNLLMNKSHPADSQEEEEEERRFHPNDTTGSRYT